MRNHIEQVSQLLTSLREVKYLSSVFKQIPNQVSKSEHKTDSKCGAQIPVERSCISIFTVLYKSVLSIASKIVKPILGSSS